METAFMFLAFLGGVDIAFQIGINSQLKSWLNHPLQASLISFTVGAISLFFYNIVLRLKWPEISQLAKAPWWVWIGGVLGSFYVFTTVYLSSKLEATLLLGLIIFGQMLVALILDHYGLFGFTQDRINFLKVLGVIFMVLGLVLLKKN